MKAARLHAIGDFRVDTVPVPTPNGAELLVRIGACGVCGSDIPRIYVSGKTYLPARDFWIAGTELLLHDRFSGICSHRCIARLIKYRKPVWMSKWTFRTLWERRGQTSLLQSR